MREARSLSSNAAWSLFMGLIWPTLLMFATTRIYLHYLGVRQYGVYAVANAVVMVAGTLRLGATEATVKYVAHHRAGGDARRLSAVVGATLIIYAGAALVGSASIFFGASLLASRILNLAGAEAHAATWAIRIAALGFPANLLASAASSVFAGFERYDKATQLSAGLTTAGALAGLCALTAMGGLRGLFLATVTVTWIVSLAALIVAWRWCGLARVSWSDYASAMRDVLGFGLFSSVNALAYTAFNTIDRLIVGAILGAEAVAHYSVSAALASRIYTVAIAATQAILPRISAMRAAGSVRGEEARAFYSALAVVIAFAATAAALLSGASRSLLVLWLGPEFAGKAAVSLATQSWAYAILATTVVPYYFLNAIGRPQVATLWFAVGAMVQYPMMYLLGLKYGMSGVLASTFIFPLALLGMLRAAAQQAADGERDAREVSWLARSAGLGGLLAALCGMGVGAAGLRTGYGAVGLAGAVLTVIIVGAPVAVHVGRRRLETLDQVASALRRVKLRLVALGMPRA